MGAASDAGRRPQGVVLAELAALAERTATPVRLIDPGGVGGGLTVSSITHDSRLVAPGGLFACLRGDRFDGHEFASAAVEVGAGALLVDHPLAPESIGETPQLVVDDTRVHLGPIAAAVFGRPSEQLVTVGITGTNGKTTTAHLLAAIFEAHGWSCGVVGTLHGPRTTPEAPELQAVLAGFVAEGMDAAVLEVSSHALALHRVDGTRFDAVVFTNLGRDHLDLHGSAEEYFRAKASLFHPRFSALGVINVDDLHGRLLADACEDAESFRVVRYGLDQVADVRVEADRHAYRWGGSDVDVAIGGAFNVANSLAALTTATLLGVPAEVAARGLRDVPPVPGRFELVARSGADLPFSVVVDYAHTPDGLAELLVSARQVAATDAAVTVVFGCGGERDHDKRPEMGAVASRGADRVIVTSDNPRSEEPQAIINEILAGVDPESGATITVEVDRRAAIGQALAGAGPGDVVVIAGKGHESTQDLGHTIVEFDDRAVVEDLLEEMP